MNLQYNRGMLWDTLCRMIWNIPSVLRIRSMSLNTKWWKNESLLQFITLSFNLMLFLLKWFSIVFAMVFVATFTYAILYTLIMPKRIIEREIFFNYGLHREGASYVHSGLEMHLPLAEINFVGTRVQWEHFVVKQDMDDCILKPNAAYDIIIELSMPENEVNLNVGNFMVNTTLYSTEKQKLATSLRPGIVKDCHWVLRLIKTGLWSVPYVMGIVPQVPTLSIVAMNSFIEYAKFPLGYATIGLNHPTMHIYAAKFIIIAKLGGIRYWMYYWFYPTMVLSVFNIAILQTFVLFLFMIQRMEPENNEHLECEDGELRQNGKIIQTKMESDELDNNMPEHKLRQRLTSNYANQVGRAIL